MHAYKNFWIFLWAGMFTKSKSFYECYINFSGNSTDDGIALYVMDTYGEELFNSSKEIKFGAKSW